MIVEDSYKVGDSARVTLLRDGRPFDVNVELTEEPG
jgi:S1-C subfamily serine protease